MLYSLKKRPQVVHDLTDLANYIARDNLSVAEDFLVAAEESFLYLSKFPFAGKKCQFRKIALAEVRRQQVKRFNRYLIFYFVNGFEVEIIRVLDGARNIEFVLASNGTN